MNVDHDGGRDAFLAGLDAFTRCAESLSDLELMAARAVQHRLLQATDHWSRISATRAQCNTSSADRHVHAPAEGGTVAVEIVDGSVEIFGAPAGLRDLARTCLALADPRAPDCAHIHLDAGINPLGLGSASLMLARHSWLLTP